MAEFLPGEPFALFDDESGARLFHGLADILPCHAGADLDAFLAAVEAAGRDGAWVVLAADFEAGAWLEPRLSDGGVRAAVPLMTALVFRHLRPLDAAGGKAFVAARLAELPPGRCSAGVTDIRSELDEEAFSAGVRRIRDYIAAGDCYQVNFTFGLHFRPYGDPFALYARLRAAQPVRYGAYVELPGRHILSLSPELFLERHGSRLLSRPMKGTAPRGRDEAEDARRKAGLAASAKDRAENVMIVDLIRNDLGRVARPGSVRVERLCGIETYPTVFQMVSDVSAEVPRDTGFGRVFRALFPCGSITGAPKIRAMEIIRELEAGPRGLYTGSLGWIAPDGDFRLNVAIRTLVLQEGRGRLGVGAGIVADSIPAAEWQECRAKARFLTGLPPPFGLIESLRLEAGSAAPYPLLERHLARLSASAASLGFPLDGAAVRSRLLEHAAAREAGLFKTRLELSPDGSVDIRSDRLPAPPQGPVGVIVSEARLDSGDPLLIHKTTARSLYDGELARIAGRPGLFDVLFLNERGEVCEGARSSVFAEMGGRLCTPPLSCGLLDGVLRRSLLEAGQAEERVLLPGDLLRADRLFVGNAVRGLMPALLLAA